MNGLHITPDVRHARRRLLEVGDFPTTRVSPAVADRLAELLPASVSESEKEEFRKQASDVLSGRPIIREASSFEPSGPTVRPVRVPAKRDRG